MNRASTIDELLRQHDIVLDNLLPGNHYTTCPECSHLRKKQHRSQKKLCVKIDNRGVCWHCNHCDWSGPEKGDCRSNATYTLHNYRDDDNQILYTKWRFPKGHEPRCLWKHRDANNKWLNGMSGRQRVLYCLPQVLAAIEAGQTIVVAEGESDVDALWNIGIAATCSPHGAHKPGQKPKWTAADSEWLRGADVVVLCDHDEPGYLHQAVTAEVTAKVARRVRVLKLADHWPDCPPGGDVRDWLAAGHTKEELLQLIETAPDWKVTQSTIHTEPGEGLGVTFADFHAYLPEHNYIFTPTRETWPANSVNSLFPPVPLLMPDGTPVLDKKGKPKWIAASEWFDKHQAVHQATWAPGLPMLIKDRLIGDGGWITREGVTCFNLYRPPITQPGDPTNVKPWLDLISTIYPNDCDHIIAWLAHRVQRPHEKINHTLVLGGPPGIGKDSLLAPVRYAIGPWNFEEVSPSELFDRFNGFVKSVILRVSEARDLGDVTRYQFYDHMKVYCAAPPEVLRCNDKYIRAHKVLNVCAPIITTNYKTDGIYLPQDDRRHYVAWSDMTKENFAKEYWPDLWRWYIQNEEGYRNVAAYLASYSLENFDAKAPPPQTEAFWAIVDAHRAPEDAELADVLDKMKNPQATTLEEISNNASGSIVEWLDDRSNRRKIPHRLEKCGYVPVRNDDASDGLFKIGGARQVVYALATLTLSDRLKAVQALPTELKKRAEQLKKELAELRKAHPF